MSWAMLRSLGRSRPLIWTRHAIRSAAATPFRISREPTSSPKSAPPRQPMKQSDISGFRPSAASSPPLEKGEVVMKIGKHQGKTFAEIYSEDPQYCRWACKEALTGESSSSMTTFAAYVQHRWLLAIHGLLKQAKPNSLKGQQLAVTGEPQELSRCIIESLIPLLGGQVTKISGATGLVAGSKLWNGESVAQSPKMQQAMKDKIPVLSVDDFHTLVAASTQEKVTPSESQKPKAKPKGKSKAKGK